MTVGLWSYLWKKIKRKCWLLKCPKASRNINEKLTISEEKKKKLFHAGDDYNQFLN
jgi:hypothetical protein